MTKIMHITLMLMLTVVLLSIVSAADTSNDTVNTEKITAFTEDKVVSQDNTLSENVDDKKNNKVIDDTELTDEDTGTGCSSVIIQGYNNDSSISFRRDATNKLTINVKHDNSIVKQYKEGSYFFHVLVSKDGWMVGNGGADNSQVNHAIEDNALSMINKNSITSENMNNIYNQESRLSLGHFVIKAPNGSYSLIIKNGYRVFKDSGVLKSGQYLIVPNSMNFFRKNSVDDIKTEDRMIYTSRMLTARDGFGVNRREIVTYYYKNNRVNSTVKVTATNDNGRYVGRRTAYLIDDIRTNNNYYSSSSIPVIDGSKHLDTVNFFLRKTRTKVSVKNIVSSTGMIELSGTVRDEFGRNVNTGQVIIKVDGKTLKNSHGNIHVKVVNGSVKYKSVLKNLWSKKKHDYMMTYMANSVYDTSKSGTASISVNNFFRLRSYHKSTIIYGNKLSINSFIRYNRNNSFVDGGRVFYKINGKTVLNSKNQTLYKRVMDGKTVYNHTFKGYYGAKRYTLTTVYVNGAYRKEYKTYVTVKRIPTRIINANISTRGNLIKVRGKLVDNNKNPIKYDSNVMIKINGKTLKNNKITRKFLIKKGYINFKFTVPLEYRAKVYKLSLIIPETRITSSYNRNYTVKV
ncbi:MAG: hypothetical protein IJI98_06120 [Methanosphaera sp.]|nr:hypothetical protein [Methanosphaera sp.]